MPIKVTYQDEKGNPIEEQESAPIPITTPDRNEWEDMQAEAYQKGIYEEDFDKPEGEAAELLKKYGITPAKLAAFRADIAKKEEEQKAPDALPEVVQGITSKNLYNDLTPRQRYVHYAFQRGDKPVEDYETDIDAFLARTAVEQKKIDEQWAGYGDPKADINYHPEWGGGFGSQPGVAASTTPVVVADPRFPTRDPITGRVTPAKIAPVLVGNQGENDAVSDTTDDEE